MVEVASYEHGMPSWTDLGVPDPKRAARFYSALFGWDVQEGPPESGGYAIAHLRGKAVAGLGPQQNPGPPVWMAYVNVDSADDTIAKVKANGGTVFMEPLDVMDVGRMAIFADPQGAVIALWQPNQHKGAGIVEEVGTLTAIELMTTDEEAAKRFYSAVFGWGSETHTGGPSSHYTEFKLGDMPVAGMIPKTSLIPAEVPPHWMVYFAVADADEAVKRIEELGGSVLMAPFDVPMGRLAVVTDDQGAAFNVLAHN